MICHYLTYLLLWNLCCKMLLVYKQHSYLPLTCYHCILMMMILVPHITTGSVTSNKLELTHPTLVLIFILSSTTINIVQFLMMIISHCMIHLPKIIILVLVTWMTNGHMIRKLSPSMLSRLLEMISLISVVNEIRVLTQQPPTC